MRRHQGRPLLVHVRSLINDSKRDQRKPALELGAHCRRRSHHVTTLLMSIQRASSPASCGWTSTPREALDSDISMPIRVSYMNVLRTQTSPKDLRLSQSSNSDILKTDIVLTLRGNTDRNQHGAHCSALFLAVIAGKLEPEV